MARRAIEGFEIADTAVANVSYQNSVARNGGYALRVNPSGATAASITVPDQTGNFGIVTSFSIATLYVRFYFRYATKAAATFEPICDCINSSLQLKFELSLSAFGILGVQDNTGTVIANGTTVLQPGVWYRIEAKIPTGTTSTATVWVDGNIEMTATGNFGSSNNARLRLGKTTNRNSNTVDYYYDDVALDDAALPGPGFVERLLPSANGGVAQWTSGTNASDYLEVDEVVSDQDTTYIRTVNPNNNFVHAVALGSGSKNRKINAVTAIAKCRDEGGVSQAKVGVRVASTNYFGSASSVGTTYVYGVKIFATNPNTSKVWTKQDLDALEAAVTETNSNTVRCTVLTAEVEYQERGSGGLLMGVG